MSKPLPHQNQPLYITSLLLCAFGMDTFTGASACGLHYPLFLLMLLIGVFSAIGVYMKRLWMLKLLGRMAPWLLMLGGCLVMGRVVLIGQGLVAGVELDRNAMLSFVLQSSFLGSLILVLHALALWALIRLSAQSIDECDTDRERAQAEMAAALPMPRLRSVVALALVVMLLGLGARLWTNPWRMLLEEVRALPELTEAHLAPNCITPTVLWSSPLDPVLTARLEIRQGDEKLYYIGMVRPWAGRVRVFPISNPDI